MFYKKMSEGQCVIRLVKGEKIVDSLRLFVEKEKIEGGFFIGLGAADEFEIAHYDVLTKKYSTQKFSGAYEIISITGNISWFKSELIVHAHATFSDKEMKTVGGHVVEVGISGTLELLFTVLPRVEKKLDEETGLKVWDLPERQSN